MITLLVIFLIFALLFGLGTAVHVAASLLWLLVIVAAIALVVGFINRPRR